MIELASTDIPTVVRRRSKAQLLDPSWGYIKAADTDVLATFKRVTGWVPPSHNK